MPEKTKYNLVDDAHDPRIPMHNEEVFQHGVIFEVKLIGSLDVVRPSSRMEILAAMRRVRVEFKVKNIKKKKVNIIVAVDGLTVTLRKKKKKKERTWADSQTTLTQDPIYRIFYVSHDSQDMKIFSYIARDRQSNVFHCNVFKSKRKSQAMQIVRTVGQVFEVCHKLNPDSVDRQGILAWMVEGKEEGATEEQTLVPDSTAEDIGQRVLSKDIKVTEDALLMIETPMMPSPLSSPVPADSPLSVNHQIQLLQRQLQQQEQTTQAATAQASLLQQQLSVEAAARTEAQARVQQLLQQNTTLLRHLSLLVKHIQELELKVSTHLGYQDSLLEIAFRANVPAVPCDPTAPRSLPSAGGSPLGTEGCLLQLDGFRFLPGPPHQECKPDQDQDSGQGQDEDHPTVGSPQGDEFLSTLEIPGFRESGIASEYESNTDESDDRDSWGQGEEAV